MAEEEEEEWDEEYEDEYEDGEFEDDADGDFEDGNEEDPDFADADFGDDDGFEDGGDGWGDDDVDVNADQQYIPIQVDKPNESDEEAFALDKDGNIISPKAGNLKRAKSVDNQCWTCSNCKAINKLTWTFSKFAMKCCICKQDTYSPTVKIFNSDEWDEPSNDFWECPRCTLHNTIGTNECQACQQLNDEYIKESDDEENGQGMYQKGEDSSDAEDDQHPMSHMHGGGMGGGGRMRGHGGMGGGRFPGHGHMHGMGGGGGMDPMMGMFSGLFGAMGGGPRMGMGRRRKKPRDTRPYTKKKEANLRNLLIVGFIRKCDVPQLPTKFFDYFNFYYLQFDRWDWDFFRSNWTTKQNDLITIKRGKKDNGKWRNMFGLKHIKMNPKTQKFPNKFSWTLRILDRKQMESVKDDEEDDEQDEDEIAMNGDAKKKSKEEEEEEKKKKEKYELQYMDIIVGVVNVEKLGNQGMAKAFNQYSCGYGLFAGNGKICKSVNDANEWLRVFKPIKHGESVSVNLEWMTKGQYKTLYATPKELEMDKKKGRDKLYDDYCVALTFTKPSKPSSSYPKGGAFMLPWSSPYKLAVASAKKRWEIEWVSSNWCCDIETDLKTKDDDNNMDEDDDNKDEIN